MLYLVTNRHIVRGNFLKNIENALAGGVDRVILREKDLECKELFLLSKYVKVITDRYDVPLIINGNIDVAEKTGAYGFHCEFQDFIENKYKYDGVLGVSIHSIEEGVKCEQLGADYILAGHIFETECKKGLPPRGIEFLKELKENVSIPIVAIEGIDAKNEKKVIKMGMEDIAVMSYIMKSKDPYYSAKVLKSTIEMFVN
ncbi:thiamine phosphate synthase [Sporanaerobacter acetigenes]|uniref:thiamine phosphate synthase n=1 Tax=Sporanaerobacter acetigenes TaxID=165813 RepID=UPI001046D7FE|nr:thiamine phosphate synthase [Sporanaerobacter acetigenes]